MIISTHFWNVFFGSYISELLSAWLPPRTCRTRRHDLFLMNLYGQELCIRQTNKIATWPKTHTWIPAGPTGEYLVLGNSTNKSQIIPTKRHNPSIRLSVVWTILHCYQNRVSTRIRLLEEPEQAHWDHQCISSIRREPLRNQLLKSCPMRRSIRGCNLTRTGKKMMMETHHTMMMIC